MNLSKLRLIGFALVMVLLTSCGPNPELVVSLQDMEHRIEELEAGAVPVSSEVGEEAEPQSDLGPADVSYTLMTGESDEMLVFFGVGGDIDGQVNPTLTADPGMVVQITLINGHPVEHDLRIDEFSIGTGSLTEADEEVTIKFAVAEAGQYYYYCTIPGHRAAGMEGLLQVGAAQAAAAEGVSVVKNPADLPGPIGDRGPELVQVELVGKEVVGQLADGTTLNYFTFNGTVPGPFIRARVGDTVEITLTNETESAFIHSIDLHAVNGPGGGAVYSQTDPGETTVFNFKALNPGIYVYHCATPSVPHHISNGMYGLILIEPEGGLPEVDREFYVMQGEIYTVEPLGTKGHVEFSHDKMLAETPEYFVFNGSHSALAGRGERSICQCGRNRAHLHGSGWSLTSPPHSM